MREVAGGQRPAATERAIETPLFLRQAEDVLQPVAVRRRQLRDDVVRDGAARPEVALQVEAGPGEEYLLIVKHPSGALSFHGGTDVAPAPRRGQGKKAPKKSKAKSVIEFRAPISPSANPDVRRARLGDLLQGIVDAIVVKVGTVIAETAVDLAEAAIWRALGRTQGLHRVTPQGLRDKRLEPVARLTANNGRALLFLHGTFSTTQSAFGELANSTFFDSLQSRYGDAIYGFDHFTVSVTPEQNANDLLALLPQSPATIDVVTHSRGGLVLRNLVERRQRLTNGDRFVLGRAVLVACPNEGTPLATPDNWQATIGWIANLLDLFPPNPLASNASMVAHWIAWFVKVGIEAAEGLASMDVRGKQVQELQRPPKPALDQYSALVSNYEADGRVLARALDLGLDSFFETANDLVVPTAGRLAHRQAARFEFPPNGWAASARAATSRRPGARRRISLSSITGAQSIFSSRRCCVNRTTCRKCSWKSSSRTEPRASPRPRSRPQSRTRSPSPIRPLEHEPVRARSPGSRVATGSPRPGALELTVISTREAAAYAEDDVSVPLLLASYDGARVSMPFRTSKRHVAGRTEDWVLEDYQIKELAARWGALFATHRKIKRFVDSSERTPPPDADLLEFGELLFETLLPGDVKRLFDVARSREQEKLLIIFTSTIPWVFDMPWEFARDPTRGTCWRPRMRCSSATFSRPPRSTACHRRPARCAC